MQRQTGTTSEPPRLEIQHDGPLHNVPYRLDEGEVVRVVPHVVVALPGRAEADDEGVGEARGEVLGGVVAAAGEGGDVRGGGDGVGAAVF